MKSKKAQTEIKPSTIDDNLIEGPVKIPEKKEKGNKKKYWIFGGAAFIILMIILIEIGRASCRERV